MATLFFVIRALWLNPQRLITSMLYATLFFPLNLQVLHPVHLKHRELHLLQPNFYSHVRHYVLQSVPQFQPLHRRFDRLVKMPLVLARKRAKLHIGVGTASDQRRRGWRSCYRGAQWQTRLFERCRAYLRR